jgi:AcrR family transcriptional regulator
MPPITKKTWLKEGLKVLAESGVDGLTIENLAARLSVTKGSFYHHFANRALYAEELLKFWETENTLKIKHLADEIKDPQERIKRLIELTSRLPHEPEVAIRAWALRNPLARTYQKRIDRMRLSYLEQVHSLLTTNKEKARMGAQLAYAVLVGSQQMVPAIQGKRLKRLFEELVRGFYRRAMPKNAARPAAVEDL